MARTPIIAGNWKMNNTIAEGTKLVKELAPLVKDASVTVVVCPTATALAAVADAVKGTKHELCERPHDGIVVYFKFFFVELSLVSLVNIHGRFSVVRAEEVAAEEHLVFCEVGHHGIWPVDVRAHAEGQGLATEV